jgi:RNA polymerase sigma-70 factor (ECF subfamily)
VSEAVIDAVSVGAQEERFESLYRQTFPRVYAYVASMLHDRSAAEEVTAQAFERAFRKRSSYKPRRGTPEAWLFGIARNAALDELRRLKRRAAEAEISGADDHSEDVVLRQTVRTALATLDPKERDLLALKYKAGLSNGEIARVLRVSESNVGSRLHRTMEKLRRACDEDV